MRTAIHGPPSGESNRDLLIENFPDTIAPFDFNGWPCQSTAWYFYFRTRETLF